MSAAWSEICIDKCRTTSNTATVVNFPSVAATTAKVEAVILPSQLVHLLVIVGGGGAVWSIGSSKHTIRTKGGGGLYLDSVTAGNTLLVGGI